MIHRWLKSYATRALGYSVLIGTIITVDLRLLGLGVRRQTTTQIADQLAAWTLGSLAVAMGTGLLLFSYDPIKFYRNKVFPFKIVFLIAAVGFHYTALARIAGPDAPALSTRRNQLAAGISLALWLGFGAGWAGALSRTFLRKH